MSSGGQRPPANRMSLATFKARLGGATKGYKLLKKKRDALKTRFVDVMKDIVKTKLSVVTDLKEAAFGLAKANWCVGGEDISSTAIERAQKPAVTVKLTSENVAGVSIPAFVPLHDKSLEAPFETIGCNAGGFVIKCCRETYFSAVMALVKLASQQTAFCTLDEEIKMTSRRVNALEYVLIPRINDIIKYIDQEMDEQAREEFFRVKKVVEKKKQKMEREKLEDAAAEAENAALKAASAPAFKAPPPAPPAPVVSAVEEAVGKDEDIVFDEEK